MRSRSVFDAVFFVSQPTNTEGIHLGSIDWLYIYMPLSDVSIFWPGLILLGILIGLFGGGFGMGGAWMVTPGLNILGFTMPFAIGTAICHIAGMSMVFALRHPRFDGKMDYKLGLVMLLGAIAGIEGGLYLVMYLERAGLAGCVVRWVYVLILVFFLVVAFRQQARNVVRSAQGGSQRTRIDISLQTMSLCRTPVPPVLYLSASCMRCSVWGAVLVSLMSGMVTGFLGMGGGLLLLPVLAYPMGISSPVVIGTDIVEIMTSGMYGAFTYAYKGRVELVAVFVLMFCSIIGEQIGNRTSPHVSRFSRKQLSIATILLYLVSILLQQAQYYSYSAVVFFSGMGVIFIFVLKSLCQGIISASNVKNDNL